MCGLGERVGGDGRGGGVGGGVECWGLGGGEGLAEEEQGVSVCHVKQFPGDLVFGIFCAGTVS
jgi:hypothetical protein